MGWGRLWMNSDDDDDDDLDDGVLLSLVLLFFILHWQGQAVPFLTKCNSSCHDWCV